MISLFYNIYTHSSTYYTNTKLFSSGEPLPLQKNKKLQIAPPVQKWIPKSSVSSIASPKDSCHIHQNQNQKSKIRMLDDLPFEIQLEIMKRLPVQSLIQFQSVSKTWKSKIHSSAFVAHYSSYQTQPQHILVAYEDRRIDYPTFVSIADDHTFPQTKVTPTLPLLLNILKHSILIGSSHGLVCLSCVHPNSRRAIWDMAVLWNPSIRRAIPVVVPNVEKGIYHTFIGFGVCRVTTDPKIVKITYVRGESDMESISICSIPRQVEVFTLSTGVWRSKDSNVPRKSIRFYGFQVGVVVDGCVYWLAEDRIKKDGGNGSYILIMSFDITSEEFREVNLPHSLASESYRNLFMSKLRESLVVLQRGVEENDHVIGVWRMEDGVEKSFVKLLSVNVGGSPNEAYVRGFRKSGEPMVEILEDDNPIYELNVYDPHSKHVDYVGISGIACTFYVFPYMETLLLLDQQNLAVYSEMETIRFLDDLVS